MTLPARLLQGTDCPWRSWRQLYLHGARHEECLVLVRSSRAQHPLQGARAHRRHRYGDLHSRDVMPRSGADFRLRLQGRRHSRHRRRSDGHASGAAESLTRAACGYSGTLTTSRTFQRASWPSEFRRRASRPPGADGGSAAARGRAQHDIRRARFRTSPPEFSIPAPNAFASRRSAPRRG